MDNSPELLLVPSFRPACSSAGKLILSKRFLQAIGSYAAQWPGKITVLYRSTAEQLICLDPVEYESYDYRINIEVIEDKPACLVKRLQQASVMLITLDVDNISLSNYAYKAGLPVVWVTEVSVRSRAQMIHTTKITPLRRAKRLLSNWFHERKYEKAISRASGAQCNGMPTYLDYRIINSNVLLFFDSRVTCDLLVEDSEMVSKAKRLDEGTPLRLAYSGRLTEIKGVHHLPRVAAMIRQQAIPFTLDIYGDGNLKSYLLEEVSRLGLSDCVFLRGVLDFRSQLMPTFRESVDVFLCCHLQGDPSCTYLETLACGVPIIGYANEAWRGMYDLSIAGWMVEIGDFAQMADTVADLNSNRTSWLPAARAARHFAERHTFEETIRKRVDHLCHCARQVS